MLNTDERVPNLYCICDNEKLAINAIPEPDDATKSIPLGLKLEQDGDVVFRTRDLSNLPTGIHVYFADADRGVIQDISEIPNYSQSLRKGSYENRFYLMFSRQLKVALPGSESLAAYTKGSSLFVNVNTAKGMLTLTNSLGQTVREEEIVGPGLHELKIEAATGVYIVTFTSGKSRLSKKLLFQN